MRLQTVRSSSALESRGNSHCAGTSALPPLPARRCMNAIHRAAVIGIQRAIVRVNLPLELEAHDLGGAGDRVVAHAIPQREQQVALGGDPDADLAVLSIAQLLRAWLSGAVPGGGSTNTFAAGTRASSARNSASESGKSRSYSSGAIGSGTISS